jgi:hypothetical protein
MTRWIFIAFFGTAFSLLFSLAYFKEKEDFVPYFLRYDHLSEAHSSEIKVNLPSKIQPSEYLVKGLTKDYDAIWAHLNYLYGTNDVHPIKEWVTERFYLTLVDDYQGTFFPEIRRSDLSHNIYIHNWSQDGLVCHLVDSAAVLQYEFPDGKISKSKAQIAVTLLFQGDNWRLDALNVFNETLIID